LRCLVYSYEMASMMTNRWREKERRQKREKETRLREAKKKTERRRDQRWPIKDQSSKERDETASQRYYTEAPIETKERR